MTKHIHLIATDPCLEAVDVKLTDVSSKSQMENNGWSFDTDFDKTALYKDICDMQNTWYGYKFPGEGTTTAKFTGSGTATLDYGNCYTAGKVNVYLNGVLKDVANMNMPSKSITFNFSPNDALLLSEDTAIIKLNSLNLTCKGNEFKSHT